MAENRELALVLKLVADQFSSELKKQQGALSSFNSFIKDWKTQLTVAGTALFAIAKSTANYGEEALKSAQRLGVSVQTITAFQHAANMADVSRETLERGLKTLAVTAVQAAQNTGEGAKVFNQLGLSATDAAGRVKPLDQLFFEFQDRLKGVTNAAQFMDLGVKAFGKSFLEMVPLIKQGSAETKALMVEAEKLGLVLSTEDAEAANKFNDEIKTLLAQVRGISLAVGKELIPILTDLIGLLKSDASQFFFKGLSEEAVLFSTFVKEAAANVEFLFGKLTFDQLKTKIKGLEAEGAARLLQLENPEAKQFLGGATPAASKTPGEMAPIADQEKLAKALIDIWQSQDRAIDIRNKQVRENTIDEYLLRLDREAQLKKIDEDAEEAKGRQIVERTQLEVAVRDAAIARERDGLAENAQAWMSYYDQVGGSSEGFYAAKMDLLRAQLGKELDLNADQSAQLLTAWQDHDSARAAQILASTSKTAREVETIELRTMQASIQAQRAAGGSILEGWADGMRKYVGATESAFGLAQDMARRTAQAMEQSFRQFFFDAMEQRITSFKDVLRSFGNFFKQIMSQILAQLATMLAIKGLMALFGGGAGSSMIPGLANNFGNFGVGQREGGFINPQRFDFGGTVLGSGNRDTVRALLSPGEGVLSRRGMAALDQLNNGSVTPGDAHITVNVINPGRTDQPQVNYRRQLKGMMIDILYRDSDLRGMLGAGA